MKIVVLGAGAMGGMFGARLLVAGNDVVMIDDWKEHVEKMQQDGLRLETRGMEAKNIPVKVVSDAKEVTDIPDVVLVFVKGHMTTQAVEAAKHLIGPDTYVLTVQNGVGNAENIDKVINSPDQIIIGVTVCSAVLIEPGKVNDTSESIPGLANTHVASFTMKNTPKIAEIAETFTRAGLAMAVYPNADKIIWSKLAVNCCANAPCVLTRVSMDTMVNNEWGPKLHAGILTELVQVAKALGIELDLEVLKSNVAKIHKGNTHHPSMAQDVFKKRQTEVETITGAIVKYGKQFGIPTPVNETIYNLVSIIDHNYDKRWY